MIAVILVEPENAGNVGAVARVMANFGFSDLFLVNPRCDHLSDECRNRAKNAQDVLKGAKVLNAFSKAKLAYYKFDYLIATSARVGDDYNIPRSPLTPEEFVKKLKEEGILKKLNSKKGSNLALVFGRESCGLTNEEVAKCDFMLSIPASKDYSALNLSHSVAIVLYEIFKGLSACDDSKSFFTPASSKDKEVAFDYLKSLLDKVEFSTKGKKDTQEVVWKKLFGKSFLSKREIFAIIGLLKKLGIKIKK